MKKYIAIVLSLALLCIMSSASFASSVTFDFAEYLSFSEYSGKLLFIGRFGIEPVSIEIYEDAKITSNPLRYKYGFDEFHRDFNLPVASWQVGLSAIVVKVVRGVVQVNIWGDWYEAKITYSRYATINGSQYVYNKTDGVVVYTGVNERHNTVRAYITGGPREPTYSHSQKYFGDYSLQGADAYAMYKTIGVKP